MLVLHFLPFFLQSDKFEKTSTSSKSRTHKLVRDAGESL